MVNKKVYDVTQYLKKHPGGVQSILMNAGDDASDDFTAIHSNSAWKIMERFIIGELREGGSEDKGKETVVGAQSSSGTGTGGQDRAIKKKNVRLAS